MLAALVAAVCVIPLMLVLGSFIGIVPNDFNMLLLAIPVAGIGIIVAVVGWSALGDLLLPRPVLTIDEDGIWDRRATDGRIPWSDLTAATSLLGARGGVVLELKSFMQTAMDPFRPGTFMFERPGPGVAHIAVRAMTVPAATLTEAILRRAEENGATVGSAQAHEKMQRRRWFV